MKVPKFKEGDQVVAKISNHFITMGCTYEIAKSLPDIDGNFVIPKGIDQRHYEWCFELSIIHDSPLYQELK